MASHNFFLIFFLLLPLLFWKISASDYIHVFTCLDKIQSCNALLYQHNNFKIDEVASLYSVNASNIKTISYANKVNYLVPVNCSCKNVDGVIGYFYDVVYKPKSHDIFYDVSINNFSGVVWDEVKDTNLTTGVDKILHLLCGCVATDSQVVVTYSVQAHDTVSTISNLLTAESDGIEKLNTYLGSNPSYIDIGWLLYVPMEKFGIRAPKTGNHDPLAIVIFKLNYGEGYFHQWYWSTMDVPPGSNPFQYQSLAGAKMVHKWTIIIGLLSVVTLFSICALTVIILRKKRSQGQNHEEDPKPFSKNLSTQKSHSLQKEDITVFESEKPTLYSIEEIEEGTNNFDETRKIGQGGYGSVYYGVIGEQEIAIKKMKSNKSKEFLAELNVLGKIHHINVVALLGYATGDDHLYLVYEYIANGSLSDHLHDPLLKGHQPLSWNARTQVALDAARGIEYIHDHTKARYVHRDIKTTNILLDGGLRAKVADFGLAKLVGRTNEDELYATRLVGTPGYLPPESVKELQVTTKTDIFAFGVVLAELITGQRALVRDNQEPNRMKSLITIVNKTFNDENPESALELIIDGNLKGNYPPDDVYKMAEVAHWCLSEEALDRPDMREVVITLSRIRMSSIEWEASLGGSSQVFSGVSNGR